MTTERRSRRDKRVLALTHNVEAAVELAHAVPRPPLPHLPDLHPLVQVGVEALDAGQGRHAVVASHGVHKVLAAGRSVGGELASCSSSVCAPRSYPQRHRSHAPSGCVHRSHGAPGVAFDVVTLHIVEAGVVIQPSDGVDGTAESSQSDSPPGRNTNTPPSSPI